MQRVWFHGTPISFTHACGKLNKRPINCQVILDPELIEIASRLSTSSKKDPFILINEPTASSDSNRSLIIDGENDPKQWNAIAMALEGNIDGRCEIVEIKPASDETSTLHPKLRPSHLPSFSLRFRPGVSPVTSEHTVPDIIGELVGRVVDMTKQPEILQEILSAGRPKGVRPMSETVLGGVSQNLAVVGNQECGVLSFVTAATHTDVTAATSEQGADGCNSFARIVDGSFRPNTRCVTVIFHGWPHVILTTIPGVAIEPGEELVCDFCPTWDDVGGRMYPFITKKMSLVKDDETMDLIPSASAIEGRESEGLLESEGLRPSQSGLESERLLSSPQTAMGMGPPPRCEREKIEKSIQTDETNGDETLLRILQMLAVGEESPFSQLKECDECRVPSDDAPQPDVPKSTSGRFASEFPNVELPSGPPAFVCRFLKSHAGNSSVDGQPVAGEIQRLENLIVDLTTAGSKAMMQSEIRNIRLARRNASLELQLRRDRDGNEEVSSRQSSGETRRRFDSKEIPLVVAKLGKTKVSQLFQTSHNGTKMRYDGTISRYDNENKTFIVTGDDKDEYEICTSKMTESVIRDFTEKRYDYRNILPTFADGVFHGVSLKGAPKPPVVPRRTGADPTRFGSQILNLSEDDDDDECNGGTLPSVAACAVNNQCAERLRPWPTGITWNPKKQSWTMRSADSEGETCIRYIAAVPYGGVSPALKFAHALRQQSTYRSLNQDAGLLPQTENITWNEAGCKFTCKYRDRTASFSALKIGTQKAFKRSLDWINSLRLTSGEELVHVDIPIDPINGSEDGVDASEPDDSHHEIGTSPPTVLQKKATYHHLANEEYLQMSNQVARSLQPYAVGVIWARTTGRWFALYRDEISKKKRFKTFDPRRHTSVKVAYDEACLFLQTAEAWIGSRTNTSLADICSQVIVTKTKCSATDVADFDLSIHASSRSSPPSPASPALDDCEKTPMPWKLPPQSSVPTSGTISGLSGSSFYSGTSAQALEEMEQDIALLDQHPNIRWYRSKRGFLASSCGISKWFSAYQRGVPAAHQMAMCWLEMAKQKQQQEQQNEDSVAAIAADPTVTTKMVTRNGKHQSSNNQSSSSLQPQQQYGESDGGGRRRLLPAAWMQDSIDGGSQEISEIEKPSNGVATGGGLSPKTEDSSSALNSSGERGQSEKEGRSVTVEELMNADENGKYASSDSEGDIDTQAKKMLRICGLCWVGQKQSFSVFYWRNGGGKTTKAFNPVAYGGVKRAYRAAVTFAREARGGLQLLQSETGLVRRKWSRSHGHRKGESNCDAGGSDEATGGNAETSHTETATVTAMETSPVDPIGTVMPRSIDSDESRTGGDEHEEEEEEEEESSSLPFLPFGQESNNASAPPQARQEILWEEDAKEPTKKRKGNGRKPVSPDVACLLTSEADKLKPFPHGVRWVTSKMSFEANVYAKTRRYRKSFRASKYGGVTDALETAVKWSKNIKNGGAGNHPNILAALLAQDSTATSSDQLITKTETDDDEQDEEESRREEDCENVTLDNKQQQPRDMTTTTSSSGGVNRESTGSFDESLNASQTALDETAESLPKYEWLRWDSGRRCWETNVEGRVQQFRVGRKGGVEATYNMALAWKQQLEIEKALESSSASEDQEETVHKRRRGCKKENSVKRLKRDAASSFSAALTTASGGSGNWTQKCAGKVKPSKLKRSRRKSDESSASGVPDGGDDDWSPLLFPTASCGIEEARSPPIPKISATALNETKN